MNQSNDLMQKLTSLLKRRGFIWQSSEIYGGAAAAYDYGPLGTLLKNNLKNFWLKSMIKSEEDIVPLDSAIFMHPKVWEASGHTENFIDPMVECQKCRRRFKAGDLPAGQAGINRDCPECGGPLGGPRQFNLMFETHLGPVKESASIVYLRPETAQGIYVGWQLVQQSMRLKIPFGIAQIGKAFRNEITPSNFTYRTVEFEQMEMQFFVKPDEAGKWFKIWRDRRLEWYTKKLGLKKENLRLRPHKKKELAHYAKEAEDIEYKFPFSAGGGSASGGGWNEIEGVHDRGDWDLKRHQEFSGKDLTYFDEETSEKFLPHVVETSGGVDRVLLTMLIDAYHEETVRGEERVVLKLPPWFTPYRLAVFPLVRTDKKLVKEAKEIFEALKPHLSVDYDEQGTIGRRYRRHDEVGTPWCVTIDGQTLEDGTVTVRDRDTLEQVRVRKDEIREWIDERLNRMI